MRKRVTVRPEELEKAAGVPLSNVGHVLGYELRFLVQELMQQRMQAAGVDPAVELPAELARAHVARRVLRHARPHDDERSS